MGRMDFKRSLCTLRGLVDVARRKSLPGMVPFLRAGGVVLVVAVLVILSASSKSHSQSGRQKPANANSNDNTRPRQVSTPKNSNSSTTQQTNTPAASKSDAEQGKGEEAADVVRVSSNLVPVPTSVVDNRGIAVTNLKLEDFELRIDGQPNLISDISRA